MTYARARTCRPTADRRFKPTPEGHSGARGTCPGPHRGLGRNVLSGGQGDWAARALGPIGPTTCRSRVIRARTARRAPCSTAPPAISSCPALRDCAVGVLQTHDLQDRAAASRRPEALTRRRAPEACSATPPEPRPADGAVRGGRAGPIREPADNPPLGDARAAGGAGRRRWLTAGSRQSVASAHVAEHLVNKARTPVKPVRASCVRSVAGASMRYDRTRGLARQFWSRALGKYDRLADHLRKKKLATYEMSFAEVERVLGAMLPNSARRPEWWANETLPQTRHVQCRAWLTAGYKAFLQPTRDRVRFERS